MPSSLTAISAPVLLSPPRVLSFPGTALQRAPGGAAGLLDEVAAGPGDRVLIIGAPDAELLCDALRHGCRSALETVAPPAHPEPADVVVAPRVASEAAAAAVALGAWRALAGGGAGGRLAVALPGRAAQALARSLVARLRSYGFAGIRLRARAEGGLLLVGQLPRPLTAPAR